MGKRQTPSGVNQHQRLYILIVVARISAAFSLFFAPFWGVCVVFLFDWLDSYIIIHRLGWSRARYERWDKNVDWISQTIMIMLGSAAGFTIPMITFGLYRFIGYWLFVRTDRVTYFLLFPNIIEPAYIWWVAVPQEPLTHWMSVQFGISGLIALCLAKCIQESVAHVWAYRLLERVKRHGGYPKWMQTVGFHNLT